MTVKPAAVVLVADGGGADGCASGGDACDERKKYNGCVDGVGGVGGVALGDGGANGVGVVGNVEDVGSAGCGELGHARSSQISRVDASHSELCARRATRKLTAQRACMPVAP